MVALFRDGSVHPQEQIPIITNEQMARRSALGPSERGFGLNLFADASALAVVVECQFVVELRRTAAIVFVFHALEPVFAVPSVEPDPVIGEIAIQVVSE